MICFWYDQTDLRILLARWLMRSQQLKEVGDAIYFFEKPWKFNAEFFDMLKTESASLVLRCVACKKSFAATDKQVAECEAKGFAVCKCGSPAIVVSVKYLQAMS